MHFILQGYCSSFQLIDYPLLYLHPSFVFAVFLQLINVLLLKNPLVILVTKLPTARQELIMYLLARLHTAHMHFHSALGCLKKIIHQENIYILVLLQNSPLMDILQFPMLFFEHVNSFNTKSQHPFYVLPTNARWQHLCSGWNEAGSSLFSTYIQVTEFSPFSSKTHTNNLKLNQTPTRL